MDISIFLYLWLWDMPNMAYDKLIVLNVRENTQEYIFKTTSPVHSNLYHRSIKFYVNTEF